MITLSNINVTFQEGNRRIHGVKDVSLQIKTGEIFGIIGYSGAGKSTLVRVINLLQKPTSGSVIIGNQSLLELTPAQLRQRRKKIGMIFQGFNLMESRTIFENVYYPLRRSKLSKQERHEKVISLLELVGLSTKLDVYPSQLSGGQKQRVAIARALANDPEILLCDEATSALDPSTTSSILQLLKKVNQELGLTIVIITHEMEVIKQICHRVAVMDGGCIIETNDIVSIFSKPQKELTKDFIYTANHLNHALESIFHHPSLIEMNEQDVLVQLSYVGSKTSEPYLSRLYSHFQVEANILYGNIEVLNQTPIGHLIVILSGTSNNRLKALNYLNEQEIQVRFIELPSKPLINTSIPHATQDILQKKELLQEGAG